MAGSQRQRFNFREELMSIFATKPIEQLKAEADASGEHSLRRVLGPFNLVTLGIGAIIGTGIFVLTGQAAAANAGPAIVLSMVLAGLASVLAALCYAEFASSRADRRARPTPTATRRSGSSSRGSSAGT